MGSFGMAIDIVKADIKVMKKEKKELERLIERKQITSESLRHGQKIENKK